MEGFFSPLISQVRKTNVGLGLEKFTDQECLNECESVNCFVWIICMTLHIMPQVMVTKPSACFFIPFFIACFHTGGTLQSGKSNNLSVRRPEFQSLHLVGVTSATKGWISAKALDLQFLI